MLFRPVSSYLEVFNAMNASMTALIILYVLLIGWWYLGPTLYKCSWLR